MSRRTFFQVTCDGCGRQEYAKGPDLIPGDWVSYRVHVARDPRGPLEAATPSFRAHVGGEPKTTTLEGEVCSELCLIERARTLCVFARPEIGYIAEAPPRPDPPEPPPAAAGERAIYEGSDEQADVDKGTRS